MLSTSRKEMGYMDAVASQEKINLYSSQQMKITHKSLADTIIDHRSGMKNDNRFMLRMSILRL